MLSKNITNHTGNRAGTILVIISALLVYSWMMLSDAPANNRMMGTAVSTASKYVLL